MAVQANEMQMGFCCSSPGQFLHSRVIGELVQHLIYLALYVDLLSGAAVLSCSHWAT